MHRVKWPKVTTFLLQNLTCLNWKICRITMEREFVLFANSNCSPLEVKNGFSWKRKQCWFSSGCESHEGGERGLCAKCLPSPMEWDPEGQEMGARLVSIWCRSSSCFLLTAGKYFLILGVRLEKPPVYRMMWKLFCGNPIVNQEGTNECPTNTGVARTLLAASILAAAYWETIVCLSNIKTFSFKVI